MLSTGGTFNFCDDLNRFGAFDVLFSVSACHIQGSGLQTQNTRPEEGQSNRCCEKMLSVTCELWLTFRVADQGHRVTLKVQAYGCAKLEYVRILTYG